MSGFVHLSVVALAAHTTDWPMTAAFEVNVSQ
jgi:hypothetical protein